MATAKNKRRLSNTTLRAVVGTLTCGLLTGLTFAAFSTILLYGIAKEKTGGSPTTSWVTTIATIEFIMGLLLGCWFGLILSLANLGRVFGTIVGLLVSIVPLWLWLNDEGISQSPFWPTFLKATVPVACGLVGLVTSTVVSSISRRRMETSKTVG